MPLSTDPPRPPRHAPPRLQVVDAPAYQWRGVLLDVGRHFYSCEFVKRLLDLMAMLKMNRFHWHLTEDQVGAGRTRGGGGAEAQGRARPAGTGAVPCLRLRSCEEAAAARGGVHCRLLAAGVAPGDQEQAPAD